MVVIVWSLAGPVQESLYVSRSVFAFLISECPDIELSEYPNIRISEYPNFRISEKYGVDRGERAKFCLLCCLRICHSEHSDIRIFGYSDIRTFGHSDIRTFGHSDIRFHDLPSSSVRRR